MISVAPNDLPIRLAEVLSQLWKSSGAGSKQPRPTSSAMENSLQLKVKCRMSMSLVFDSVWRWREEFQAQGRGNLEGQTIILFCVFPFPSLLLMSYTEKLAPLFLAALKNPTNPDSNVESSATSVADHSHAPSLASGDPQQLPHTLTPEGSGLLGMGESYNEVFDPLNWMFDGFVDFPTHSLAPAMPPDLEGQ